MHMSVRSRLAAVIGWFVLVAALLGTAAAPVRAAVPQTASSDVPPGVTAGIAIYDRQTGTFSEQLNPHLQFRAASVVKLLIALDHVWNRGPDYNLPADDRSRLDAMLRSSDDAAASHYWSQNGGSAIVGRMVSRLGLTDTAGPPAGYPGYWGYTALSAADTVRIYRYILDSAPAPVRDLVMDNLRQSTRCGTDGFDQRFGIPASFERPWAVKQGWSGFGSSGDCSNTTAARTTAADVDLTQRALHSTGTVGTGDRSIVAVFTLQPQSTSFGAAYTNLNRLVRSLNVPGGIHPAGTWFGTWGSGVRVRAGTTTTSTVLTQLPAGVEVLISCQERGQEVEVPPYRNDWWAYLPLYGGYITNIYVRSPDNKLPNVPTC
ncbi:D-alanyl-D-alanine carboxypeptidase family protein [Streptomyces bluensis]|uniref:Lipoprotein n=1 Tax=Streptomyces bluensis TaxID=33897 RepID=A0ABW6UGY7_9ACTN